MVRDGGTVSDKSPGQVAFEAYSAKRGGKNHDGTPTPEWPALTDGVREGWEAAAWAAIDAFGMVRAD